MEQGSQQMDYGIELVKGSFSRLKHGTWVVSHW